MTILRPGTGKGFALAFTVWVGVCGSVLACIDVGHKSEIGCVVDMTEPGCAPSPPDGATTTDATADANPGEGGAASDTATADAGPDSQAPSEADAGAGDDGVESDSGDDATD